MYFYSPTKQKRNPHKLFPKTSPHDLLYIEIIKAKLKNKSESNSSKNIILTSAHLALKKSDKALANNES